MADTLALALVLVQALTTSLAQTEEDDASADLMNDTLCSVFWWARGEGETMGRGQARG